MIYRGMHTKNHAFISILNYNFIKLQQNDAFPQIISRSAANSQAIYLTIIGSSKLKKTEPME